MLEKVGPFRRGDPVRSGWLQQMLDALKQLMNIRGAGGIGVSYTPGGVIISGTEQLQATYLAKIISVSGSFPVWTYSFQKVTARNSDLTAAAKWVASGPTLTMTNRLEFSGTAPYTYGLGITITSSSGQVNSTSCVIKSIGVGAVVQATEITDVGTSSSSKMHISFAAENSAQ